MANYSAEKRYTWGPDSQFVLSGAQFGLVINALRAILSTPEAEKILLADRANNAIEEVFANAVEQGIATEIDDAPKALQKI